MGNFGARAPGAVAADRGLVADLVPPCIDQFAPVLPRRIGTEEGEEWGFHIGACAGKRYSLMLEDRFVASEKCSNPTNFAPR